MNESVATTAADDTPAAMLIRFDAEPSLKSSESVVTSASVPEDMALSAVVIFCPSHTARHSTSCTPIRDDPAVNGNVLCLPV